MLAADGCASSLSNPACCFCGVWAPSGPREWRSPCPGSHWLWHAHLPMSGSPRGDKYQWLADERTLLKFSCAAGHDVNSCFRSGSADALALPLV